MIDENLVSAVLEDWATILDAWVATGATALTDQSADLVWADDPEAVGRVASVCRSLAPDDIRSFLLSLITGVQHSMLTVLDGATEANEVGQVRLVDGSGNEFPASLHEIYFARLMSTGRLD